MRIIGHFLSPPICEFEIFNKISMIFLSFFFYLFSATLSDDDDPYQILGVHKNASNEYSCNKSYMELQWYLCLESYLKHFNEPKKELESMCYPFLYLAINEIEIIYVI